MSKSKDKHFSISATDGRKMRNWSPQCVKLAVTAYSLASDNYGYNYGYVCVSYGILAKTAGVSSTLAKKWAKEIGLEYRDRSVTAACPQAIGIYLTNPRPCIGPPPKACPQRDRSVTDEPNTHYIVNKKEELIVCSNEQKEGGGVGGSLWDKVWALYPRKVGKAKALSCYLKLESEERLSLLAAVEVWGPRFPRDELQYCPHFTTYINRRGWEDEEHPGQSKWGGTVPAQVITNPEYWAERRDFDD